MARALSPKTRSQKEMTMFSKRDLEGGNRPKKKPLGVPTPGQKAASLAARTAMG
jgi:hypothetical protein